MKHYLTTVFCFLFLCAIGQTVSLDPAFNSGTGPNNSVIATAVQADGKILITGGFFIVDGQARNSLARMNADGSLDATFNPFEYYTQGFAVALMDNGDCIVGGGFQLLTGNIAIISTTVGDYNPAIGFDDYVWALTVQSDQKILVGGTFHSYEGTSRNGIARLAGNLALDATFDPGTGFDGTVRGICVQSDQKILAGGTFTTLDGVSRNGIARLNTNGTIDASFNPGTGFDSGVQALKIQSDGKIIAVGGFTSFNGINRNRIARINTDGTLDASFDPGTGFDGSITTVNILADGKILVGGDFTTFNGTARNRIARLNSDGTLDTSFDPGTGFDALVWSLNTQSDGKIIAAGNFTSFNGTAKSYLARLDASASEIEEINTKTGGISVYPNPSGGQFTISLNKDISTEIYVLYDQVGKRIHSGSINGNQIQLDLDLEQGLYYMQVGNSMEKIQIEH